MSTSPRAQELAEQLLGLEATRSPLPSVEKRHFGMGMGDVKAFMQKNKKAVIAVGVVVVAVAVFAGYKMYKNKQPTA